jgi:hypothetical protein
MPRADLLRDLHTAARNSALNITNVLDALERDLENPFQSSPTDDDIPF